MIHPISIFVWHFAVAAPQTLPLRSTTCQHTLHIWWRAVLTGPSVAFGLSFSSETRIHIVYVVYIVHVQSYDLCLNNFS